MVHLDAALAKSEEPGDKGLKGGALGFVSSVVVGWLPPRRPTAGRHPRLRGDRDPPVCRRPSSPSWPSCRCWLILIRVQGAPTAADPDCGTTFTLGHADLRAQDGVAGWVGDHRRRHPGDGQPGPDRRPVRLLALQCQRDRPQRRQRLGAAGRGHVDRGHDGHLLMSGIEISANFQKVLSSGSS